MHETIVFNATLATPPHHSNPDSNVDLPSLVASHHSGREASESDRNSSRRSSGQLSHYPFSQSLTNDEVLSASKESQKSTIDALVIDDDYEQTKQLVGTGDASVEKVDGTVAEASSESASDISPSSAASVAPPAEDDMVGMVPESTKDDA